MALCFGGVLVRWVTGSLNLRCSGGGLLCQSLPSHKLYALLSRQLCQPLHSLFRRQVFRFELPGKAQPSVFLATCLVECQELVPWRVHLEDLANPDPEDSFMPRVSAFHSTSCVCCTIVGVNGHVVCRFVSFAWEPSSPAACFLIAVLTSFLTNCTGIGLSRGNWRADLVVMYVLTSSMCSSRTTGRM